MIRNLLAHSWSTRASGSQFQYSQSEFHRGDLNAVSDESSYWHLKFNKLDDDLRPFREESSKAMLYERPTWHMIC